MLYFAYGSNMNWAQMQRRCPSSRFLCTARLPGYRFAIARHSRLRKCGTANLLLDPGSTAWGIVYDVSAAEMLHMDRYEDGYSRHHLSVFSLNDDRSPLEVVTYIAPHETDIPLTNAEYKRLVLEGAHFWGLPIEYRQMLERIEAAVDGAVGV